MALLEVIHLTGDIERRDLYKRQPMTIGSHSSCDLRIEEKEVERIHCRISWNKENWEATAAGETPIELNGVDVQRAILKSGDTLRFGTVDVKFHGGLTAEDTPQDTVGLKPTSEEAVLATKGLSPEAKKPVAKSPKTDEEMMQSLELLASDSHGSKGKKKAAVADDQCEEVLDEPSQPASKPAKSGKAAKPASADDAFEEVDEEETVAKKSSEPGVLGKLASAVKTQPRRPGDDEPLKSPLVIGLLSGIILLVLAGLTFYFIAGRRIAELEFEAAKGLIDAKHYQKGIEALTEFYRDFPGDPKVPEAKRLIGLAEIDQKIGGSDFGQAVLEIRKFVNENGDKEGFETVKIEVAKRAHDTCQGAAKLAGSRPAIGDDLLTTAREALQLFVSYSSPDANDQKQALEAGIKKSQGLIAKYQLNTESAKNIEAALAAKNPMAALSLRRELLTQYPELENEKEVKKFLERALELEKSLIQVSAPNTAAETTDPDSGLAAPRSMTYHARIRTDGVSVNEVVWAMGKDCLYGVDTVTGLPVWRRAIGADQPFFPVEDDSKPSLVCFDSDHDALVRIHRNQGTLIWRLPLGVRISGKPLLYQGQIYLTTADGTLLQVDLETGSVVGQMKFNQPVVGPGVIEVHSASEGQPADSQLVVIGDQDVVYTLSRRPFECVGVSYFAQKPESVRAPLISMGPYCGFVENHSGEKSTLHLLKRDATLPRVYEVAQGPITGSVMDEAVIRGRDLFVPSTIERVNSFTVSDAPNEPVLTVGPTFQVQGAKGSPIFLTLGPERQVWMSSSALRKLQLTTDSIQVDPTAAAIGLSSQPNQHIGNLLFNARRRPFSDGVTFTQTDRDTLTSEWQLLVGARILAMSPHLGENPSLLVVNEGGAPFRVPLADLSKPGFHVESTSLLPVNPETTLPLMAGALPDGQVAVACGSPEARVWVINRLAQIEKQGTLPSNPQAPPVALGKRIVVPLEGRLHVARTGQTDALVQDFQFPTGEAAPVWRQVLAADDKTLIGLTEDGQLMQFRLEANPRPHLAEVAKEALSSPAIGKIAIWNGRFAVGTADGELSVYDGTKFSSVGKRKLSAPTSGPSFVTEAGVIAEIGSQELHCLNADSELTDKWKIALPNSSVAGQPQLIGNELVLAFQNGTVLNVNPQTGEVLKTRHAGGGLDSGPVAVGDQWYVLTIDGSLVSLSAAGAQP